MRVVCARCQRYLGTQPPFHDVRVSHGLCMPCAIRLRRELSTVVISRERADAMPILEGLLRGQSEVQIVLDRRKVDRRQADVAVEACRRGRGADRRQVRSLRLI